MDSSPDCDCRDSKIEILLTDNASPLSQVLFQAWRILRLDVIDSPALRKPDEAQAKVDDGRIRRRSEKEFDGNCRRSVVILDNS